MKKILIVALLSLGLSSQVWAISLDDAKAQGLVGELSTGYLGAVKPSGEVNRLVDDINNKRRELYQEISKKTNTSINAVEAQAGKKAINKTSSGHYINTGGGWKKK